MKVKNFKNYTVLLLLISIFNISCYSYYEIRASDLKGNNPQNIFKIEKKDKSSAEGKLMEVNRRDSLLIVQGDSVQQYVPYSEIEKLYEEKIDAGKTILFIPVLVVGFLAVLFLGILITSDVQIGG